MDPDTHPTKVDGRPQDGVLSRDDQASACSPRPNIPDHDMIRQIGKGAYGEVWLARSVLDTYRAVKVVNRDSFSDEQPYEREFNGIRKYEPISRADPGLLDILQIGRNDEAGHFYYVMELADDALSPIPAQRSGETSEGSHPKQQIDHVHYVPKTLSRMLLDCTRLSVSESVALGLSLTKALGFLHENGLVHRDVKPSNIVFVRGEAKLTDIGLIAEVSEAHTMVGTQGFIAPEGPNSPQGDVFSLGKVLYEASTGKDRQQFPEPVSLMGGEADVGQLMELNEVILKACEMDPRKRYQSVSQMREDLELIQAGRSLKQKRLLERRLAVFVRIAAVSIVVAILLGIAFLIQSHQTGVVRRLAKSEAFEKDRAESALRLLEVKLAQELFRKGESSRALEQLAGLLRKDPADRFVAEQVLAALGEQGFSLPRKTFTVSPDFKEAVLSPDDECLVTLSTAGELRMWNVPTGEELALPFKPIDPCDTLAFDAEGERLAVAFADATLLILSLGDDNHARNNEPFKFNVQSQVESMRFSPNGKRLVAVHEGDNVRVWNTESGDMVSEIESHEGNEIFTASFSPDGEKIATAAADDTARVWNVQTGEALADPLRHGRPVNSANFSPDGTKVLTASNDYTAQIWNAESGEKLVKTLRHQFPVRAAAFSPCGTRIVTASNDRTARLWDARTGESIGMPMRHKALIRVAQFSPDGLRVVTSGYDYAVAIWDAHSGQPLSAPMIHSRNTDAQFTARGNLIMTAPASKYNSRRAGGARDSVWFWDALPGPVLPVRLFHDHMATFAKFGPIGETIVTLTDNHASTSKGVAGPYSHTKRNARVWDVKTGQPIMSPLIHGLGVTCADIDPGRKRLATGSRDGTARIWDLETRSLLFPPLEHEAGVSFLRFISKGSQLLTFSWDGTALIWDAESGRLIRRVLELGWGEELSLFAPMRTADLCPNERWFATPSQYKGTQGKGPIAVWDITETEISEPIILSESDSDDTRSVRFSPDGQRIVASFPNRAASIWETSTGRQLVGPLEHHETVHYAEFSPDGRLVVTASADRTARIWDAETGQPLNGPLEHEDKVVTAKFSPDGLRLVTASWDRTARVWDVSTGMPLMNSFEHEAFVHYAEFSPDGKRVATACFDGTVQLWEIPVVQSSAPPWLTELAEIVAGVAPTDAPVEALIQLKRHLAESDSTDTYTQWARWFLADRATRTIAPNSAVTTSQYARQQAEGRSTREPTSKTILFQERRRARLKNALHVSPNDALVQAHFALSLVDFDPEEHPRAHELAMFFCQRAFSHAPDDAFVRNARAKVIKRAQE